MRQEILLVVVSVLVAGAAIGAGEYASRPTVTSTSTVVANTTVVTTHVGFTQAMEAIPFSPQPYEGIRNAWLLYAPTGDGKYAIAIHAEGLQPTDGSKYHYLVEGVAANDSIRLTPIGPDVNSSKFTANGNGVGDYFAIANKNPHDVYLSIVIVKTTSENSLNGTIIATAPLNVPAAG